jgi:hypothetical protein
VSVDAYCGICVAHSTGFHVPVKERKGTQEQQQQEQREGEEEDRRTHTHLSTVAERATNLAN